MVIEHLLAAIAAVLLAVTLMVALFFAVIQTLYFSPNRPRRMPAWLIVAILIAFLVMPKIDTVYALNRAGDKAEVTA